ncbi:MAG: prohibitin family protein [Flavobacteriales bacterium]|nr:prohibitin family protein [Flavobacteriales bacterium]
MNNPRFLVPFIVIAFIVIYVLATSTKTIDSGQAGVLYRKFAGGVDTTETFSEGFHIIAPWNTMFIYEVRQQEIFEQMSVLSSNGLDIKLDASLWFQPKYNYLALLHKEKGGNYIERIIMPAVRSATRSVVGRYTPEQIYSSKRDVIQEEIFQETKRIVDDQYLQVNSVLVRDVTLPTTIKEAIERKLRQEQESLEYEFRLEKATKEAERQEIESEGKATANRILSQSLTDKILREKGIMATLKLAESPNAKVVVIGSGDGGLPIILNGN